MYFDQRAELWVGVSDSGIVNGKRSRRYLRAKVKGDLLRKLTEQRSAVGVADRDNVTTAEWLDWWLENVIPGTVSDNTDATYRAAVRNWIAPYIGRVRLTKLRPEHVMDMMRGLEAAGRAPATRRLARTVLRRSLNHAMRFDRVTRNVAALTDAPKQGEAKLDDALDADEAKQVLATAKGDRLEALAVLVLSLGLRQGEALSLRWDDIDLDGATVRINNAKTSASVRTVALPAVAVAALRRHRARQGEERLAAPTWVDPELVFTTALGSRISRPDALRWWHALTIAAGVGRRRFHASRHTAATLMLNNGVALEVVSKTLGHSGLAITADIYAKVRPELQRTAATAMDAVLGEAL